MSVSLNWKKYAIRSLFGLIALAFPFTPSPLRAQQAGGVAPSGPQVRMVRGVVGAKGESRNGTYLMTDPRTVFYIPDDHEVVVYFEWQGSIGKHHCEGSVRGPNGEFAAMSSFDYVATQPRFGGFWKMPLSGSTPAGSWIFESKVDGESAGQVSFQVIPGARPGNLAKESAVPSVSDLYKSALSAAVQVEELDANGKVFRRSTGFSWKHGEIVTSFRNIDGATSIRVHTSDGRETQTDRILAWNRRQDWAILAVDTNTPVLTPVESKSWNVGDPCYWLDTKNETSRILSEGQIVGLQSPASWGDRIDISGTFNGSAAGGPLLNVQGNVIGILGGFLPESLLIGDSSLTSEDSTEQYYSSTSGSSVAITLLPHNLPAQPITLKDLWTKGEMIPPVTSAKYVSFGQLTQGSKDSKNPKPPIGFGTKVVYQRSDASINAVLTFTNNENLKSTSQVTLYDVDNHLIAAGKPQKLTVNRSEFPERLWRIPLAGLPAGIYRVDILVGDGVAWRHYFKLTD